jgi:hypothetical protein
MPVPSFGSYLRACRLGYRWADSYQCFIRMSALKVGELICVEVAPDRGIPSKTASKEYRCWWDKPEVLDLCPALKDLGKVTRYQKFYVNDDGERVSR